MVDEHCKHCNHMEAIVAEHQKHDSCADCPIRGIVCYGEYWLFEQIKADYRNFGEYFAFMERIREIGNG